MFHPKHTEVIQLANNGHLGYFQLNTSTRSGENLLYAMSSRHCSVETLYRNVPESQPDAVCIAATMGNKLVLVRQYRYPLDAECIELVAGLIDKGETAIEAAVREMREETGLAFVPDEVQKLKPSFNSAGMTDERTQLVFGSCEGRLSNALLEDSESLEVILATREDCLRFLQTDKLDVRCQLVMLAFAYGELDKLRG